MFAKCFEHFIEYFFRVLQCLLEDAKHYTWWVEYMTAWLFLRYCFKWKNEQFRVYQGFFLVPFNMCKQEYYSERKILSVFSLGPAAGHCRETLHIDALKLSFYRLKKNLSCNLQLESQVCPNFFNNFSEVTF